MASQPRKFSEKIALHNQKQAEGDAAFQQIMREVNHFTSTRLKKRSEQNENNVDERHEGEQQKKVVSSSPLPSLLGGSLPNVNNVVTRSCGIKPSRSDLEDLHISRVDSTTGYRERGRSVGSVGPIRGRTTEKRVADASPYSCGPYLSPPSADLSWRRTNSDSALHQSVQTANPTVNNGLRSPGSQRRATAAAEGQYDPRRHLSVSSEKRPRSCCDVPSSIPDINIYPSQQDPGTVQIPIGNNTGSLPDLSNFQFQPPISPPLDQDDHSTYSSASPQCTSPSPSTLSPTSLPPRTAGRFSFGSTPPHESPGPPSYSPISPSSPTTPRQLYVPPYATCRYLQPCKGYVFDDLNGSYRPNGQKQQIHPPHLQNLQHLQQHYVYQSPQQHSPSDILSPTEPGSHRNSLHSYRSPQSSGSRPSPQSSPILNIKQYSNNTSPLDSAPQSPTSSCNSMGSGVTGGGGGRHHHQRVSSSHGQQSRYHGDYYISQAQDMQQQFEQIRMLGSPVSSTVDYIISGPGGNYQQENDLCGNSSEISNDQGYYSTSPSQQLHYASASGSNGGGGAAMQNGSAATTPTSIPNIVLTDFSNGNVEEGGRPAVKSEGGEMSKDLGCDISNFFPNEDGMRDVLEPIDLDGLQMFDTDGMNDPSQQHHFTLDPL